MAHTQAIAAPTAELTDVPIIYRCAQRMPAHYYREVAPGRWETAMGVDFEYPVRIEDCSRAEIEARGHVLVPVNGGEPR